MKSSTRLIVFCAAALVGLAAWYLGTRTGPLRRSEPTVAVRPRAGPMPATTPEPPGRAADIRAPLDVIGRQDPDRALVLARERVVTREQRAFYSSLFAQLTAADPAAAVSRLALVPAGESRDYALRALADGWAARDLPAALAWAQQLAAPDRAPALEAVLVALAPVDPKQAMDIARQTLTGAALDRTLTAALQSLTAVNPAEAGALVRTLAPGEVQTRAALDVARALTEQSPAEALAWAGSLSAGKAQDLALVHILEVWAAGHPRDAGNHVVALPPGSLQETAAGRVARVWGAADPVGALAWAQTLVSEETRSGALVTIASAWAQRDPAAAVHWAAATPTLAGEALSGALSYWVQQDAGATRNFVQTLAGDTQVRAAAAIAPALAQADPLQAVAWTQTLSEPAARDAALAAAYARWRLNAPGTAQAWLAAAALPAATKARLLAGP